MKSVIGVFVCLFYTLGAVQAFSPCLIPSFIRGEWRVYTTEDNSTFTLKNDVTLTGIDLQGFQLEYFDELRFQCYSHQDNYIVFRSVATKIFDTFDIRIFMCWYLYEINALTYNIIELTDPVMVGSDDHAKAYLEANSLPNNSSVCENAVDLRLGTQPPFKQLQKVVRLHF